MMENFPNSLKNINLQNGETQQLHEESIQRKLNLGTSKCKNPKTKGKSWKQTEEATHDMQENYCWFLFKNNGFQKTVKHFSTERKNKSYQIRIP